MASTNRLLAQLQAHFILGGRVRVCTYTTATIYGPACAPYFRANGDGVTVALPRRRPIYLTARDIEFGRIQEAA